MCALNNNLYERLAIEDADNFLRQSVFECANEDCDSHKKYEKTGFNADFNAARNIAMSTLWMENGQVTEKSKQEARERPSRSQLLTQTLPSRKKRLKSRRKKLQSARSHSMLK